MVCIGMGIGRNSGKIIIYRKRPHLNREKAVDEAAEGVKRDIRNAEILARRKKEVS